MRGFTLFEVILYVSILGIIIYFVGGFAFNIYSSKSRTENLQDINTNARFMLDTITQNVEQSDNVIIDEN